MKRQVWLEVCSVAILALVLYGGWALKLAVWDTAEFGIAAETLEFVGARGEWTAGLLYPLRVLDTPELCGSAVGLFESVHLFAAGMFMYVLVRIFRCGRMAGVCAGIVFMLNGAVLSSAVNHAFLAGLSYVPIVFAMVHCTLTRRGLRWPAAAGFALAFQILAGSGQIVLYTVSAAGMYALIESAGGYARRREWHAMNLVVGKLALAAAVAIAMSAPQIWMWMDGHAGDTEVYREIAGAFRVRRMAGPPLKVTVGGMLNPIPTPGLHYQYLGLTSLMLAAAGAFSSIKKRRIAAVAVCGAACLLMSSGVDSRLYRSLGEFSPGRYDTPARLMVVWTFAISLLAGFGYDYFDTSSRTHRRRMEMGSVFIAGLLLALCVRPVGQLYLVLLMFGVAALFTATNSIVRKTAQIGIIAVVLADLSSGVTFLAGPENDILGPVEAVERAEKVPRAFVVDRYEVVNDVREIRDRVSAPEFEPVESVMLEAAPGFESAKGSGETGVAYVNVTNLEKTVITTPAIDGPALLVMADRRFPGDRTVTVDGSPVSPLSANHIHQAVTLGPGPHTVTIDHRLRAWRFGQWISAVAFVILVAVWVILAKRRPSGNGDDEIVEDALE